MRLYDKAKTRSLVDFARNHGYALTRRNDRYAGPRCPYCEAVSGDALSVYACHDSCWRWHCFRCNRGGTVIDFAAAVWGITEREAAARLADDASIPGVGVARSGAPHSHIASGEKIRSALMLLFRHARTNVREGVEYLRARGIGERVITEAVRRGLLRFLPSDPALARSMLLRNIGDSLLREAGFIKPGSSWPGIAYRPMVFFFPGCHAAEFRLARAPKEGEPKAIQYGRSAWPWWWKEGDRVSTIYVVEGVIDLLSMVELGLKEGEAVMGIPGVSSWREQWFAQALTAHPGANFVIAMDADAAGQQAVQGINSCLDALGVACMSILPPKGKDWNEYLSFVRS